MDGTENGVDNRMIEQDQGFVMNHSASKLTHLRGVVSILLLLLFSLYQQLQWVDRVVEIEKALLVCTWYGVVLRMEVVMQQD